MDQREKSEISESEIIQFGNRSDDAVSLQKNLF